MSTLLAIAGNEIRTGLRNRWIAAAILLFSGLSLLLTSLGSAPVGDVKGSALAMVVANLASLSVYLVPLIALMLSHDAIVGEAERGTLLLLLTYPLARWQLLAGKFLGHLAILALALIAGFGLAGAVLAATRGVSAGDVRALTQLIASAILLGGAFIALGYLVSVLSRERATAAGIAVALWLVMVVLYDLALIGVLLADKSQTIGQSAVAVALALNPADAFRVLNLAQVGAGAGASGLSAEATGMPSFVLLLSISAWAALAAALTALRFERYEP